MTLFRFIYQRVSVNACNGWRWRDEEWEEKDSERGMTNVPKRILFKLDGRWKMKNGDDEKEGGG